jgi:hypothetical protein
MDGSYAPAKSEVENKGAIRVIREWGNSQTKKATR